MNIATRFVGLFLGAGMAWSGYWVYRFPDRFWQKTLASLNAGMEPPLRFIRIVGLLWFGMGTYFIFSDLLLDLLRFIPAPIIIIVDIASTILFCKFLIRRSGPYRAPQK